VRFLKSVLLPFPELGFVIEGLAPISSLQVLRLENLESSILVHLVYLLHLCAQKTPSRFHDVCLWYRVSCCVSLVKPWSYATDFQISRQTSHHLQELGIVRLRPWVSDRSDQFLPVGTPGPSHLSNLEGHLFWIYLYLFANLRFLFPSSLLPCYVNLPWILHLPRIGFWIIVLFDRGVWEVLPFRTCFELIRFQQPDFQAFVWL